MLILVMTVSVVALSRNMEPDCILQQRENPDAVVEDHFVNNLVSTFHTIYERMRYPEIYMCLVYFVLQGLLVPNYDDLHYIFLTEKCGLTTYMYDFLNLFTYIGTLALTVAYNQYLSKNFDARRLIQI